MKKISWSYVDFLIQWRRCHSARSLRTPKAVKELKRKCVIDHACQIPVLRQSGDVYLGHDVDPTPASSSLRGCQLVQTFIRAYDRSQNHADQAPTGMLNCSPKWNIFLHSLWLPLIKFNLTGHTRLNNNFKGGKLLRPPMCLKCMVSYFINKQIGNPSKWKDPHLINIKSLLFNAKPAIQYWAYLIGNRERLKKQKMPKTRSQNELNCVVKHFKSDMDYFCVDEYKSTNSMQKGRHLIFDKNILYC